MCRTPTLTISGNYRTHRIHWTRLVFHIHPIDWFDTRITGSGVLIYEVELLGRDYTDDTTSTLLSMDVLDYSPLASSPLGLCIAIQSTNEH